MVFGSVSQHCENNANVNTDNVTPLLTLSTSNGQQIISVEVEANKGSQFVRIAPNRNQIPSVVLEDQVGQSIAKSVTLNSPKQPPPVFSVPVVNQDTQPTVLSIEVEVNNQHEEPVVSSASSVPLSQSGPLVQLSQGSDGVVLQNAAVLHLANDQSNMLTNFDTSFSPQGGYITQIGNLIGSLEAAAALGQLQQGNPEHFVALSSSLDLRLLNVLPVTSMENDPNLQGQMIPVDQFIQTDQSTNNPSHFEQPRTEFITILPDQPTIAARDSSSVHSVVIPEHSMGHNFVITDNIESQAMTSESHSTTLSPGVWTFRREISDQAINSVNLINRTDTSSVQPSGSEVGQLSGSQIGEHAGSQLGQPPESQMGWYVSKDTGHGTIEHECSGLSVLGISQQDETSGHFQTPTLHSQQMDSTQDILKTLAQELQVAVISDESLMTLPDNEDVQHTASSSVINEGDL